MTNQDDTPHAKKVDHQAIERERKYLMKIVVDEMAARDKHQTTYKYGDKEFITRLHMLLDNFWDMK